MYENQRWTHCQSRCDNNAHKKKQTSTMMHRVSKSGDGVAGLIGLWEMIPLIKIARGIAKA